MHSHSGWSPVFNAAFAGAVILLMAITVQPQPEPIRDSLKFFASVAGSPVVTTIPNANIPSIDSTISPLDDGSKRTYSSMRLVSATRINDLAIDTILAHKSSQRKTDDGRKRVAKVLTDQLSELIARQPVSFSEDSTQETSEPASNFEVNGPATTSRQTDSTYLQHAQNDPFEESSKSATIQSPFHNASSTTTIVAQPTDEVAVDADDASLAVPSPPEVLNEPLELAPEIEEPLPELEHVVETKPKKTSTKVEDARTWPKPAALIQDIEILANNPVTGPWAKETLNTLNYLHLEKDIPATTLNEIFADLDKKRLMLPQLYEAAQREDDSRLGVDKRELLMQLHLIDFQIVRRLNIWEMAVELAAIDPRRAQSQKREQLATMIQASRGKVNFDVHPSWNEYLLLPDAEAVFNSLNPKEREQKKIARRVLARAYSPSLTTAQSEFLMSAMHPDMLDFFKSVASETPDVKKLLTSIEEHEFDESGVTQHKVNDQYQNLLWASNAASHRLAAQLNTHYRNSNFRLQISKQFLNRMVPATPESAEPISDRMQGAKIFGQMRIKNQLGIELIPDPERINLQIVTNGEVLSTTFAEKSGFRVENVGTARFQVLKGLAFARDGVSSDSPVAASTANQQLVGMSSNLDSIPLVGWMARRIARRRIESETPQTERLVRERVETSASERVDVEVEPLIAKVRNYLYGNIYQPLVAMDLEPDPVEMSTTRNELVMRYRLAGRDQMAANSARPRSPANSLLSVQVHQSAINNMLMRVELDGRKFTLEELAVHLQDRLGLKFSGEELAKHKAELEFAPFDPVRVDFVDDRVEFSLNLKRFKVGKKGKRWRNVSVKTAYIPRVNGQQIVLVQEEPGLSLSGKGFKLRDQLAVRTIFKALFKERYTISAVPQKLVEMIKSPGLAIDQFVVRNGWLGLSLTDNYSQTPSVISRGPGRLFRRRR